MVHTLSTSNRRPHVEDGALIGINFIRGYQFQYRTPKEETVSQNTLTTLLLTRIGEITVHISYVLYHF